MRISVVVISLCAFTATLSGGQAVAIDLNQTAATLKASKWAVFIHWSLGTFSDREWTPGDTSISTFNPTGLNTDQWARTAKEAGMGSLLFVTKHHDGFCLWDTQTTERNVMNSPWGADVLTQVRQSCDKYGLKLGLYFSEGDWSWPGAVNAQMKRDQMTELLTNYGKIDYMFLDSAIGSGGMGAADTNSLVKSIQPNCICVVEDGVNSGEMYDNYTMSPPAWATSPYLINDVSFPIKDSAVQWFYNTANSDPMPAGNLYDWYKSCEQYENLLLLGLGPDRNGELRDVDVSVLRTVSQMIGVPEPSSLAMGIALGIGLLCYARRRQN